MNTHHDAAAKKTHNNSTYVDSHANRVSVAHRAGIRGSSKRNQNQKPKKHHSDGHDALKAELRANGSVLEQRLASAIRTKRLDLSLPRHTQAPPVRNQPLHIQPSQIFPAMIIEHVNRGHHLTELWLTNHHLGSLPAEISVFSKLRVLGLAGNALTALPEELSKLTDLEALYLEKNRLRTVPAKVTFPPKLRELRLDSNQLSTFPTQITKLRLLNRLGLSNNQLKAVPEQIHRLRNLVELDLDYNRIDGDLPDGFAVLKRLERVGLEGNFLAERPAILDRLPVLSYIRLSGNRSKQFLPTTNCIMGTTRQPLAVPKRHDGYFQCFESSTKIRDHEDGGISEHRRKLEGLVPCRDQNILNAITY